jgi:hypothetical protein
MASNRFLKKEFGSRGCTPGQLKAFLKKRNEAPAVAIQRRFKIFLTSIVYVMCLALSRLLQKEFGSRGCTPGQLKAFLKKGN